MKFWKEFREFGWLFWITAVSLFFVAWLESASDPESAGFYFLLSLVLAMLGLFCVYPDKNHPKD